jgi:subtilase family serine protease
MRKLLLPLFLAFTLTGWAQQPLQLLHDHVRSEIMSGQAPFVTHLPSTQKLHLSLVFSLRNEAELDSLLQELYDPSSPNYRQFLNTEQFAARFSPTAEDYQAAIDFARAKGFTVTKTFSHRLTISILGTAAQIEAAFNVTMNVYQHPTENRLFFSPDREPSLPANLPVTHISGLDNFSIPRPALLKANSVVNTTGSGPGGNFLPNDMRAAYYGGSSLTGNGQCIGLAEFDGYLINDVALSFNNGASYTTNGGNYTLNYTVPNGGGTFNVPINNVLINGGTVAPNGADAAAYEPEVVLDIAQAIGMAPGVSQIRVYLAPDAWTTSGNYIFPSNSDDTAIFSQMASDTFCKQFSISWNWRPESITSNDTIFEKMLSNGQDLFAASGDSGEWSSSIYVYPEEDAYVTAVGGTELTTSGPGGSWVSETAWPDSGGGISPDDVSIPSYQSGLNGVNGASTYYRNGPDVAAEANTDNFWCSYGSCYDGQYAAGGTSFAAPRWAGFSALANQLAAQQGEPAVGFINPKIYAIGLVFNYTTYASDFHDITSGCNNSYCAAKGYDLVTGWGSPNGQNLINALVLPQAPAPSYTASVTPGPQTCGNALTGYTQPCWLTFTVTITVAKGETLYVNGSAVSLANGTTFTDSVQENWGSGYCSYVGYPYYQTFCFGFATPSPLTVYATEPGYLPSYEVIAYF